MDNINGIPIDKNLPGSNRGSIDLLFLDWTPIKLMHLYVLNTKQDLRIASRFADVYLNVVIRCNY